MNSKRISTTFGISAAIAASLLVGCTTDEDQPANDEAGTSDVDTRASVDGCRIVTDGPMPLWTTATSYVERCEFLKGDIFQYLAFSQAAGGAGRYLTWCPRHTPITQGTSAWAPKAFTAGIRCPSWFSQVQQAQP